MEIAIVILMIALVGMTVLFIRERFARMDEREAFATQRKELRAWLAERITKEQADAARWTAMHGAYRAGWNDALQAEAEAAMAKAKAKAERLTMK